MLMLLLGKRDEGASARAGGGGPPHHFPELPSSKNHTALDKIACPTGWHTPLETVK